MVHAYEDFGTTSMRPKESAAILSMFDWGHPRGGREQTVDGVVYYFEMKP